MYLNFGISVFRRRIQVAAVRSTKVQTRTSSHGDDLPGQQWAGRQRVNRGGEVSSNHGNHTQKTHKRHTKDREFWGYIVGFVVVEKIDFKSRTFWKFMLL